MRGEAAPLWKSSTNMQWSIERLAIRLHRLQEGSREAGTRPSQGDDSSKGGAVMRITVLVLCAVTVAPLFVGASDVAAQQLPSSCAEIARSGQAQNGEYKIRAQGKEFFVY